MNFSFVVLHYKTFDETVNTVNSLQSIDGEKNIIIVENGSNNGSLGQLQEEYAFVDNIYIVANKENLGFAKGNNVGYRYAKEKLKADFISVINNDVELLTNNFIELVSKAYAKTGAAVIGPDIINLKGDHTNPMQGAHLESIEEINHEIRRYQILNFLSHIGLYDFFKKGVKHSNNGENLLTKNADLDRVRLHGAFLIFTPTFVKNENLAFNPNTFLYMEEDILSYYCSKKGYNMQYLDSIRVLHKEDVSTDSVTKTPKNKREFIFKNMIQSLQVYKEVVSGKK